jgi:hypothetical protein
MSQQTVGRGSTIEASPSLAGSLSIGLLALWILTVVEMALIQSRVFPALSDQFIPAKIQASALAASSSWLM